MTEEQILKKAAEIVNNISSNPDILELPARGETDNHLEKIPGEDSRWRLITEIGNVRLIFGKDNQTIEAVDPVDGPFINLGYTIGKYMVVGIEVNKDIILTLEESKNGQDSTE